MIFLIWQVYCALHLFFFFQAEDGIRDLYVTGVQTCALPISLLGNNANLLNQGGVSWLGDGGELVVVPGFPVSAAAAELTARRSAGIASGHRAPPGRQSLIIVKTSSDDLSARRIVVPDPYEETFGVISGDLSQPRSFLIARPGFGAAGTITR